MCFECDYCGVFVFFVKQKTAYEMRMSDWSSDVCSSDLDDAVIAPAPPDFARGEFHRIIDQPANGAVGHAGQRLIGLCRLYRLFRSVDMRHPRAPGRHRQRPDPRIAKQVQRLRTLADPLAHPRPLRGHVGEEGEVTKWRDRKSTRLNSSH